MLFALLLGHLKAAIAVKLQSNIKSGPFSLVSKLGIFLDYLLRPSHNLQRSRL